MLRALGESFNLMTLGGLAAAVGLVIDDAIVVVENIVLHRDAGQSRSEAIRSAIREIRGPLVGSTITPIVVFLPLVTITGVTGTFFRALAITVGVALLTSLVLALTWTPALSHLLLDLVGKSAEASATGRLTRFYERALKMALARPARSHCRLHLTRWRLVRLLSGARLRFASRHGRRRFHPGLPDARRAPR